MPGFDVKRKLKHGSGGSNEERNSSGFAMFDGSVRFRFCAE
jgi:hypothetical protein